MVSKLRDVDSPLGSKGSNTEATFQATAEAALASSTHSSPWLSKRMNAQKKSLLTNLSTNPAVPVMTTSTEWSFSVRALGRVASVEWGSLPLVCTDLAFMVCPVAIEGQDPFAYARAVAAALAEGAGTGVGVLNFLIVLHDPAQWPNTDLAPPASSNQRPASYSPSPLSLRSHLAQEVDGTAQMVEDLRILASWPRLQDATLPEPVVGGFDFDPTGVADRLGVKGLPVYTAFIEIESLRCRVCGVQSSGIDLALLHQRHRRHFQ